MSYYLDKPNSPEELLHSGVKGMKWGYRKFANDPQHKDYSREDREIDTASFGKNAVNRINRHMNEGKTYKQAVRKEYGRYAAKSAAVIGAGAAIKLVALYGHSAPGMIAKKAETNRGRAAAANLMGLPLKATHAPSYARSRRGVHNISSL